MSSVDITIHASSGMGKSSIARLIAFTLRANGITNYTIDDHDVDEIGDLVDLKERLWAMSQKETHVNIKTVQKRRNKP